MFQRSGKPKSPRAPVQRAYKREPECAVVFQAEPVFEATRFEEAIVGLYGQVGIGKTAFLCGIPGVYLLPTEPGYLFKKVCKTPIHSWDAFRSFVKWAELHPKAIAGVRMWGIDTATVLARHCMYTTCQEAGITHPSDEEWSKGWEMFHDELCGWLLRLAALGKGIIFTAHEKIEKITTHCVQLNHYSPELSRTATRVFVYPAHVLLHMSYTENGKRRCLYSRSSDTRDAKDWTKRLPAELPFDTEKIALLKIMRCYNNDIPDKDIVQ